MLHSHLPLHLQIDNFLQQFGHRGSICNCNLGKLAFNVNVHRVIAVEDQKITLAVGILPPGGTFGNHQNCQCEMKHHEAKLCIPKFVWDRISDKVANLSIYNVDVKICDTMPLIDGMLPDAMIIPDDISRMHTPHVLHMGELCSGAFAGWSHAQSVCCCFDIHIKNIFAVEIDQDTCDVYCKSWKQAVRVDSTEDYLNNLPSNKFPIFATDLEQGWWVTCVAHRSIDILAFSPPCQPWSDAGMGKGLNSSDGWVMIEGFVVASVLRPKTIVVEQVASVRRHMHWKLILQIIEKCGYKIIQERVVNMSSISPQNRERLLLVLMRNDESYSQCNEQCEFPTIGLQSMMAFQSIQHDLGSFEEYVKINQAVLEKYLDHRYLPTMKSDKKRKVDVMTYRIRQPHDCVGCIMASYGSQHDFSDDKLLTKGLFGTLLQQGDRIRFFSGVEVLTLMMPCQGVFLPKDRRLHMRILGNGITSAHAIYALSFAICALGFVDSPCAKPTRMVIETLKRRLHCGNIAIQEFADGWWISKKSETIVDIPMNIQISATIRDDKFQAVKIFRGQWNLNGFVEPQIEACDIVRFLGWADENLVQVHHTEDIMLLRMKQQMILPLLQLNWNDTKSRLVMVLIQGKFVLLQRTQNMTTEELLDYLIHQGVTQYDRSYITNMLGVTLNAWEKPPPVVMIVPSYVSTNIRWESNLPKFVTASGVVYVRLFKHDAIRFICHINSRGINTMCALFGWFMKVEHEDDLVTKISWVRRTQEFVITTEMFQSMFAMWIMQLLMPKKQHVSSDMIMISIRYYGLCVWDGYVSKETKVGIVKNPWNATLKAFDIDCPIRCVMHGRQCTDEYSLCDYIGDERSQIQIYLILPSQGGGAKDDQRFVAVNKLATVLLSRGFAVADTADYAQKVASKISSGKLIHELSIYEKNKGWDKLKGWLIENGFPLPKVNPSMEKAATKIQQAIRRKKNLPVYHAKADDFQICADHFMKHDGTPAIVLSSLLGAKTGVILLDAEDAKPWLSKPGPIVNDSLACIIVGHQCPCEDKHKCHKILLPVHDKQGHPSVIAGCMHQLGDKDIELPKDHVSKVIVIKSVTCSFTVYREECDDKLWHMIVESPVKSVLQLLSNEIKEEYLVASPWGRSWKNDRTTCSPSEASSFQFHVRVQEDKLKQVMMASGSGPIYITPKDDNKGLMKGWAVIWLKGCKKDVLVNVTTTDIQHHGLVRTTKGLGVRVLQKDFEVSFKKLRPSDRVPTSIPATYLFRIQPLPIGMSAEAVEQFTKDQGWPTRALKALGQDTWLVAAELECGKTWLRLNDQVVLVKTVQQASQRPKPVVLAGTKPQSTMKDQESNKSNDPWDQSKNDPWMKYRPLSGMQASSQGAASSSGSHQLTLGDPSLAKKLHEQDTHIKTLQQTVQDLKVMQQKAEGAAVAMQNDMDNKFQKIRSDVSGQMQTLSTQFQQSLTTALAKQDAQIGHGFEELKALFLSNQSEMTAKRPKIKGKGKAPEAPDENGDQDMGASPLKTS